jgi:hypothetical protein
MNLIDSKLRATNSISYEWKFKIKTMKLEGTVLKEQFILSYAKKKLSRDRVMDKVCKKLAQQISNTRV